MKLANNLINNINNDNSYLVKQLVSIINNYKFETIEDLIQYENRIFTIDNKILNKEERITYCMDMYNSFSDEYIDLTFEQCQLERKYLNTLKENISNNEKIKLLIKLFSLTGRELFFIKEAYDLIVNKEF